MYKEFYLMRKEPFDSHPSPDLFYKSNVHQTAWHYLLQGIKQQEPILVLAGEYGAGKTLLFLKLVRLMDKKSRMPIIAVPTPTYNFAMVLEKIVEKLLNIAPGTVDSADESRLQQAIYEYFENTDARAPLYVIIDDAQEFSYSFINKLRLFASYNCNGFFPIRLIFFAHHSFLKMLTYKKLMALGQRIKRIYHLKPLNYEEIKEYIYFRLIHSGATGAPVFDDDAIRVIQAVSEGNPRLINNVCDNCLLLAGNDRVNLVDAGLVRKAMEIGRLPGVGSFETSEIPVPENINSGQRNFQSAPGSRPDVVPPAGGAPNYPGPMPFSDPGPGPAPQFDPPRQFNLPPDPEPRYQGGYPPSFQAPQYYTHPGSGPEAEPFPPDERKRSGPGALENIWSRYGKIGVIILLLLIALFLASYVFGSGSASSVGKVQHHRGRIFRDMPSQQYTVLKTVPDQNGDWASGEEKNAIAEFCQGSVQDNKTGKYHPVLLTESVGS